MRRVVADFEPDAEQRRCYDCRWCKATAVSWWCRNREAVEARGTSIPGVRNCKFWAPVPRARMRDFWDPFTIVLTDDES